MSSMHFWLKEGFEYLEEVFHDYPDILIKGLKRYAVEGDNLEVLSIFKRVPGTMDILTKQHEYIIANKLDKLQPQSMVPNPLHTDLFAPSEQKHLKLSDFGIAENNVHFIGGKSSREEIRGMVVALGKSSCLGIDTESKIGVTPLDHDGELLEIIQIGTEREIFVIDAKAKSVFEDEMVGQWYRDYLSDPNNKIIGHTTLEDFKHLHESMTGSTKYNRQEIQCAVIDIAHAYKHLFKDRKYSLAHICSKILNK